MHRQRSTIPALCVLIAILPSWLSGAWRDHPEVGAPIARTYSPKDYGGGSLNFQIASDSTGNLFVGNEVGLLKFNGSDWSQMPETGNPAMINCVAVDGADRIWAAGLETIGFYEPSNGGYVYHDLTRTVDALPSRDHFGQFYSLHAADGFVYLIADYSLLRWNGDSWTTWSFPQGSRILPNWVDGDLYVHVRGHGLFRFEDSEFQLFASDDTEFTSGIIQMHSTSGEGILCVTVQDGLFMLEDGRLRPLQTAIDQSLEDSITYDAVRLSDATLALGNTALGLAVLDTQGQLITQLDPGTGRIFSLWNDASAGLWVGTIGGILHIPYSGVSTFTIDSAVDAIERHQGDLYFACHDSIKVLKAPPPHQSGRVKFETIAQESSPYQLLSTPHGLLHGGLRSFGLLPDSGGRETVQLGRQVTGLAPSRRDPHLSYIIDVPNVSRIRFSDGSWSYLDSITNPADLRLSIVELPDGSVLTSTQSGSLEQIIWPENAGGFPEVRPWRSERGLPEQFKWAYCLNAQDTYLVISDRGLYRYDSASGLFNFDPVLGRDLGDNAYALHYSPLADASGWALWLPQPESQSRAQAGRLTLKEDQLSWQPWLLPGLAELEQIKSIYHESTAAGPVLWLGGIKRLLRYDLDAIPTLPKRSAQITGINETQTGRSFYAGAGHLPDDLNLEHPQKNMRFSFSALPHPLTAESYESRLLGFEDTWFGDPERSFRDYTNLREGAYTFEVRIVDEYGRPGPIARQPFFIQPPWFRTSGAYAGYSILAIGFVAFLVRTRTLTLRRRNEELELTVQARTTELKQRNLELIRANSVKQNFLASMSHEIRNPLNGILGIAQLLRKQTRQEQIDADSVKHLVACATHLHQLLDQVLDYTSLEAGKLRLRNGAFNPNELVDDVVSMHQELAGSRKLDLRAEMPPQDCLWIGDPVMIRQILINLVSNGIKYTERGGVRLGVDAHHDGSRVQARFWVEDTGPGVPEDKRDFIFEDFTRLSNAGESEVSGTGLGLAIAVGLSDLMGGSLKVDPDYTTGARFVLELELEKGGEIDRQSPSAHTAETPPLKGQRILIADDMNFNRYIGRELLSQAGAQVVEAEDGDQALDQLLNAPFDLAILDINMPKRSGNEVVECYLEQSAQRQKPIFIALSAHVSAEMEATCLRAGFVKFTQKPLEPADMETFVDMLNGQPETSGHPALSGGLLDYMAHNDSDAKKRLDERYRQSFGEEIRNIRDQLAEGRLADIPGTVHKLKGLAALRQEPEVIRLLDAISKCAKSGSADPSTELLREISELCDSLETQLDG